MKVHFTKMHGTGNDFIIIDERKGEIFSEELKPKLAKMLCTRRFSIGADGLIFVCKAIKSENDARMRIFNADGSEAEMCGNGIRCFARYLERDSVAKKMRVETLAGIVEPEIVGDRVKVMMGKPIFECLKIPMKFAKDRCIEEKVKIEGVGEITLTAVSTGNPHAVIFVEDVEKIDLEKIGPLIENSSLFPNRTNVHFVEVVSPKRIIMRTWERGAGATLACGTGAVASVSAGYITKRTGKHVTARLPGGELEIMLSAEKDEISCAYLIGNAEFVYEGEFEYE
ncbi:MAG: diaminopimelate epimerase [Candidatus Micrarchaeia archaeon]